MLKWDFSYVEGFKVTTTSKVCNNVKECWLGRHVLNSNLQILAIIILLVLQLDPYECNCSIIFCVK